MLSGKPVAVLRHQATGCQKLPEYGYGLERKNMYVEWSDGIGPRERSPFLLFIRGDEILSFYGENISGVVAIRGFDRIKNGKWSYTVYRLQVADGIRYIKGRDGWETGRFIEGLGAAVGCPTPDTWADTAKALGVSVSSAKEFLRRRRPKAAAELDEVDRALANLVVVPPPGVEPESAR